MPGAEKNAMAESRNIALFPNLLETIYHILRQNAIWQIEFITRKEKHLPFLQVLFSVLAFGRKQKAYQKAENHGSGDASGCRLQPPCKNSQEAPAVHGLPNPSCQRIAESRQGNPGSRPGKLHQRLIKTQASWWASKSKKSTSEIGEERSSPIFYIFRTFAMWK